MKSPIPSIYILKAICAIFVVFIHIHTFHEYELLAPFLRTAVPCFFMITGYFLVSEASISLNKIKRQLLKLIRINIYANVAYLLFYLFRYLVFGKSFDFGNEMLFLLRWLFIGDNICYPFWYLTTTVHTLVLLYLTVKYTDLGEGSDRSIKKIDIICVVLFTCAIILNRYSFIIGQKFDFDYSKNCFFVGLPCVLLGARMRIKPTYFKFNVVVVGMIIICLAYAELLILHYFNLKGSGSDYLLMTFPFAIFIFVNFINHPQLSSLNCKMRLLLVMIGKNSATHLYLYHLMMYATLQLSVGNKFANAEVVIILLVLLSLSYHMIKLWIANHRYAQS